MAQGTSEIRETIKQTRDEIGETVQAIGEKADIKARTAEKVADGRDALKDSAAGAAAKVSNVAQGVGEGVANATTSAASSAADWARSATEQMNKPARNQKLLICVGSLAVVLVLLARRARHGRRKQ
jgi:methyl-accepting chemotaxis protein